MIGDMAILVSWLALGVTLYELHLQRKHNEKSLQPLGQIDLEDRQGHLFVHITNQGLGPMIINQLLFSKDGKTYPSIEPCLGLARSSYTAVRVDGSVRKVILPQGRFVIFETRLEKSEDDLDRVRQQLSPTPNTGHLPGHLRQTAGH